MANELVLVFKGNTADALTKVNGLKSALGGVGSFAVDVFKGAALATAGLGLGIAAISVPIIRAGIDFNAMKETAYTAFSTILGDGAKATALMSDLQQFAAATPFEFNELADATKKLLAFGIQGEDALDILKQVGDVSSAIGAPIGEIAELYGKAHVQGRLFAEDINQLTGRGIPIIQELAKQFGVTDAEVKTLVEDGKIGFDNLETAFRDLTSAGGKFSGMMEAQSKTFAGQMSTMQDNFNQLAGKLAEPIFDLAKEGLQGLNELMNTPEFQEGVDNFVKGFRDGITTAKEFASEAKTIFENAREASQTFWRDVEPLLTQFRGWMSTDGVEALETFYKKVRELEQTKTEWNALLKEMGGTWALLFGKEGSVMSDAEITFPSLADIIGNTMDTITLRTESSMNLLKSIFRIANDAIRGNWLQVFSRDIPNMMDDAMDALLAMFGIRGEDVRQFFNDLARDVVNTVLGWGDGLYGAARSAMQSVIDGFWSMAGDVTSALWQIIQDAIQNALAALGGGGNNAAEFGGGSNQLLGNAPLAAGLVPGGNTFIINFNGSGGPTNPADANESANMLVAAMRARGVAI